MDVKLLSIKYKIFCDYCKNHFQIISEHDIRLPDRFNTKHEFDCMEDLKFELENNGCIILNNGEHLICLECVKYYEDEMNEKKSKLKEFLERGTKFDHMKYRMEND